MNWGYKILAVYLGFVAVIVFMVFRSSNEKFDLVTKDYYAKELKYQDQIERVKRTGQLTGKVVVSQENSSLKVTLPADFNGKSLKGDLLLYFPADETKDVKKAFSGSELTITLPIQAGNKGMHTLQVNWEADNQQYYYEEKIFL